MAQVSGGTLPAMPGLPLTPVIVRRIGDDTDVSTPDYVVTERYWLAIGSGRGWVPISLSGSRDGVTAEAELWPGTLVAPTRPTVAGPLTVSSTSAADGPVGVGAHLVRVNYIDADGWERFGVATLTGAAATPVPVVQHTRVIDSDGNETTAPLPGSPQATGLRINRMGVTALGSAATGFDAGNVGVLSGLISAAEASAVATSTNLSSCSCYSVPRGRVGILDSLSVAGDISTDTSNKIYFKPWELPRIDFATLTVGTQPQPTPLPLPVQLPPRLDFVMTVERTGGGQLDAAATYQIVIVPDPDDPDPAPLLQPPRGV